MICLFISMAQGMAKVQNAPPSRITLILSHHGALDVAASIHDLFPVRSGCLNAIQAFQKTKKGSVGDHTIFNYFRHSITQNAFRKRCKTPCVRQHQLGLIKRTHQIFTLRQIDGGFAAHAAVHLCQQSSGDLNKIHPPEHGGRCEARHIAGDAAAQRHHTVAPSEAAIGKAFIKVVQRSDIFTGLSGGKCDGKSSKSSPQQTFHHHFQIQRSHIAVCHYRQPFRPRHGADTRAALLQKSCADENVVFPSRQLHRQLFHPAKTPFPRNFSEKQTSVFRYFTTVLPIRLAICLILPISCSN